MATEQSSNRVNGINLNVLNETVSAIKGDPELGKCHFRARNKWVDAAHNCTTISGFYGAKQENTHKTGLLNYMRMNLPFWRATTTAPTPSSICCMPWRVASRRAWWPHAACARHLH